MVGWLLLNQMVHFGLVCGVTFYSDLHPTGPAGTMKGCIWIGVASPIVLVKTDCSLELLIISG